MTPALAATASFCLAQAASIRSRFSVIDPKNCAAAKSFGEPGREKNIFDRVCVDCSGDPCSAQAPLGWPEVIALLTKARTQATTCVQVLKSSGDKASIGKGAAHLWHGRGRDGRRHCRADDGARPRRRPEQPANGSASLETAGKGLKEICDAAVKTITPNTKGVWEEIAKGAVEPLIKAISDGVGALWTRHVEKDKLEIETKKTPVGGGEMAQVQRHRRAIAAALFGLAALAFAPAFAEDQGPNAGTDLYDRPVLAIDPGMHAAEIWAQAVDAAGRFAVTGGDDVL